MKHITCVGFDCDYTLASYVPETFETLAHAETVNKLVNNFGYPEAPLRSLSFDPSLMVRGLVIDKERGNILKVDRHKYVKLAYHGFAPLTRDERIAVYNATTDSPLDFQSSRFAMVDTLFSLAEAHLYMSLVELKDMGKLGSLQKSYAELYRDSRAAVDLAHRDGSIKRQIAADPAKYIIKGIAARRSRGSELEEAGIEHEFKKLKSCASTTASSTASLDESHWFEQIRRHLVGDGSK